MSADARRQLGDEDCSGFWHVRVLCMQDVFFGTLAYLMARLHDGGQGLPLGISESDSSSSICIILSAILLAGCPRFSFLPISQNPPSSLPGWLPTEHAFLVPFTPREYYQHLSNVLRALNTPPTQQYHSRLVKESSR
ncbi:hypothetical protein D9758_017876 [Tetrapyrgos nigripes]|uniref:Uncharacterized protein n=1 Tax=Tetrapyrgos nigripes TaxID=182062 RepID=A0A8H5BBX3_9AGAR|nr:hypothetical protein D9758_017876 [Tetrapyrgos nigripes]